MNVLVDTSLWSLALRKRPKTVEENRLVSELTELIGEMRVVMIGPIRQELLSGISDEKAFESLKEKLRAFDDQELKIDVSDFEIIPSGRIMFVPAFVVRAVRQEEAKVSQDTRFNPSTRKHLLHLLSLLEEAFEGGKEMR